MSRRRRLLIARSRLRRHRRRKMADQRSPDEILVTLRQRLREKGVKEEDLEKMIERDLAELRGDLAAFKRWLDTVSADDFVS